MQLVSNKGSNGAKKPGYSYIEETAHSLSFAIYKTQLKMDQRLKT